MNGYKNSIKDLIEAIPVFYRFFIMIIGIVTVYVSFSIRVGELESNEKLLEKTDAEIRSSLLEIHGEHNKMSERILSLEKQSVDNKVLNDRLLKLEDGRAANRAEIDVNTNRLSRLESIIFKK